MPHKHFYLSQLGDDLLRLVTFVCHLRPSNETACVLIKSYKEKAREEALFRALLAERDLKRETTLFWLAVYEQINKS